MRARLIQAHPALATLYSGRNGNAVPQAPAPQIRKGTVRSWDEMTVNSQQPTRKQRKVLNDKRTYVEELLAQSRPLLMNPLLLDILTLDQIIKHNLEAAARRNLLMQVARYPALRPPPVVSKAPEVVEPPKNDEISPYAGEWFDGLITSEAAV